jgi:hypothetical protein
MAVNYNLGKNLTADPVGTMRQCIDIFEHLIGLNAQLQAFEIKPDGTITMRLRDPLPPEQIPHLGLS